VCSGNYIFSLPSLSPASSNCNLIIPYHAQSRLRVVRWALLRNKQLYARFRPFEISHRPLGRTKYAVIPLIIPSCLFNNAPGKDKNSRYRHRAGPYDTIERMVIIELVFDVYQPMTPSIQCCEDWERNDSLKRPPLTFGRNLSTTAPSVYDDHESKGKLLKIRSQ